MEYSISLAHTVIVDSKNAGDELIELLNIDKNNTNVGTFFSDNNLNIDFLSWDDCKTLINNKMDIGSHSINHFRSSLLTEDQLLIEMKNSKNT